MAKSGFKPTALSPEPKFLPFSHARLPLLHFLLLQAAKPSGLGQTGLLQGWAALLATRDRQDRHSHFFCPFQMPRIGCIREVSKQSSKRMFPSSSRIGPRKGVRGRKAGDPGDSSRIRPRLAPSGLCGDQAGALPQEEPRSRSLVMASALHLSFVIPVPLSISLSVVVLLHCT